MRRGRVLENPRDQRQTGFGVPCRKERGRLADQSASRASPASCCSCQMSNTGRGREQLRSRYRRSACSAYDRDCEIVSVAHHHHRIIPPRVAPAAFRSRSRRGAAMVQVAVVIQGLRSRPPADLRQPQNHTSARRVSRSVLSRIAKPALCPVLGEKKGARSEEANFRQRVGDRSGSRHTRGLAGEEGGGQGGMGDGGWTERKEDPKLSACFFLLPPVSHFVK